MLKFWEEGAEIVLAVKQERQKESFFNRLAAKFFYKIFHWITENDIGGSCDFILLDRKVVTALNALPEKLFFIVELFNGLGSSKKAFHSFQPIDNTEKVVIHFGKNPTGSGFSNGFFSKTINCYLFFNISLHDLCNGDWRRHLNFKNDGKIGWRVFHIDFGCAYNRCRNSLVFLRSFSLCAPNILRGQKSPCDLISDQIGVEAEYGRKNRNVEE